MKTKRGDKGAAIALPQTAREAIQAGAQREHAAAVIAERQRLVESLRRDLEALAQKKAGMFRSSVAMHFLAIRQRQRRAVARLLRNPPSISLATEHK